MRQALLLAFLFVFGCASSRPVPVPASVPAEPPRPAIFGVVGETVGHLHARILSRACAGAEFEHLVAQVESFVAACSVDGSPNWLKIAINSQI
jgi:hypothetical protein